jgi:hypothetical protein
MSALVLAACSSSSSPSAASTSSTGKSQTGSSPVSVPITTVSVPTSGGSSSYVIVHISVAGGPEVPVQLDTGSAGLVISSSDVGKQAKTTSTVMPIGYVAGTVTGKLAHGSVKIGGLSTRSSTGFVEAPASSAFMASEKKDHGVDGILGIAMGSEDQANSSWFSPLLQLPSPYWKGATLHVATSGTGSLILGPVSPAAGGVSLPMLATTPPATYPGGVPAYQKDVMLCWTAGPGSALCGTTDMDLGSPNLLLDPAGVPNAPVVQSVVVRSGTPMAVSSPGGVTLWSFPAADSLSPTLVQLLTQGYTTYNTGIGFFFTHTIAYDVAGGQFLISAPSP